jgi:putative spermidine/putrescine transport system substrate-binding protein
MPPIFSSESTIKEHLMKRTTLNRRTLLKATVLGGSALAMPSILTKSGFAADSLTVADVGGAAGDAIRVAFCEPFKKETGVPVVNVAHDPDPVTQFKLMIDTKTYLWDACMMIPDYIFRLQEGKNYIAPLDLKDETGDMVPGMLTENWLGFSVFGILMAYNTEKFGDNGPKSWPDFFNTEKFVGRRGLYRAGWGSLEMALLADGVAPDKLYPIDVDRAFRSLEKIKKNVSVWWTSGAHNTQILQSGEVDMADTWSGRVYSAIQGGAKLTPVWQGLYSVDGWAMPINGPKQSLAKEFIRFCMRPDRQAAYSNLVANGPTNKKAFDSIAPERAKILATNPANFAGLVPLDPRWWSQSNRQMVKKRMDEWLLT